MIDTSTADDLRELSAPEPHELGDPGPRLLVLVGPTAVGKTLVAEKVAAAKGGEIVSADSMQVYRGMDVGTAKPAPADRLVPYHCVDLVDPGEAFSAALYQQFARTAITEISARGRLPVLAGGTGLYVRAAIDDWQFAHGEQVDNPVRARLDAYAEEFGAQALYELLEETDPVSAALIHPNNVRRVVRALELADQGMSYAGQNAGFSARVSIYDTSMFGLTMERDALYRRIDERVDAMIAQGLVGEVESLLQRGFRDALTAAQAIGYKELVPVIENGTGMDDAVAAIKQATRRYAKRQLTWFGADPRISWLDVTELTPDEAVAEILAALD